MDAKVLQLEPPRLKKLLGYRFIRFWLYVSFSRTISGRKLDSHVTVALIEEAANRVTLAAVDRGLL
jgi:hypothetical protein